MKILVLGGGGREHALVSKLKESPRARRLWCAPGNAGIAREAECIAVESGDVTATVALAEKLQPDLTVVGPELPLVNGIADAFRERNWAIIGPSRSAARLEGSKIFAKEFLKRHGIPTARMYGTYNSAKDAFEALRSLPLPVVIKADGLCAGKGVFLAANEGAARDFIARVVEKGELGAGGKTILVEETLEGEELSFIILTDGKTYVPLVPTRDHKRAFDGDRGPNTGGMGAYSTDLLLPGQLRENVIKTIVEPTLRGLARDGISYQGFLYIGLMLTKTGPQVLEFNCRLGDPETQAIVARMDFDLADVLSDVAIGRLQPSELAWKPGASVCVVLASAGYPGKFKSGIPVEGLTGVEKYIGVKVWHAGTRLEGGAILTSGGRVLGVTAFGSTLETALASAYAGTSAIHFDGMHYRKDIGSSPSHLTATGD